MHVVVQACRLCHNAPVCLGGSVAPARGRMELPEHTKRQRRPIAMAAADPAVVSGSAALSDRQLQQVAPLVHKQQHSNEFFRVIRQVQVQYCLACLLPKARSAKILRMTRTVAMGPGQRRFILGHWTFSVLSRR